MTAPPDEVTAAPDAVAASRSAGVLALFPVLTVAVFLLPIIAGLAGTLLPAFGYLPAIGGHSIGLGPWRQLIAYPGLATSVITSVSTGFAATLISLLSAIAVCVVAHGRPWARRIGGLVAPILSTPHAAIAIGVAFLIAPSGWIARALSTWLTAWTVPPDIETVGHRSAWPVVLCLVAKETPYLVLMIIAALHQVSARMHLAVARSLGYGTIEGWIKVVLPQIYPQIRLPVFAVLAFSLSVVDVALIVGPGNPPPLAVLAFRWLNEADIGFYFPAAAAACLQLVLVVGAIGAWRLAERGTASVGRAWIARGGRRTLATPAALIGFTLSVASFMLAVFAIAGMALWSFASQWRFPSVLPNAWTLQNWSRGFASLAEPFAATLAVAIGATLIALVLALGCLENETRLRHRAGTRALWLLYLPLLIPQIAFLFGMQVVLVALGADGTVVAVIWAHLIFVLPYVFLSLADPWRALDPRYARAAASLGASSQRIFWRIRLPLLLGPVLIAGSIGFAVSVGQYLPTIFAGAGRIATLTSDAVTLAGGADRRVIGTYAFLQAVLPLFVYLAAIMAVAWRFARRRDMTR